MAKILVADDNSNIQKMVALALKDEGIDVVAVGNGEAAVRKISDVRPDLVLADIFMPVRNGYEVCKFVKDNSSLAHIPVILLVGAFDPLDEQEAQRVGADGVLKKPFVPPDPLISMVKAALSKAGVLGKSAAAPPPPMPAATKPAPPPVPRIVMPAPPAEEEVFAPAASSTRPAPLQIDQAAQPLAFGSLLESAGVEEDAVFAVSTNTASAPERNWASSNEATEEDESEEAGSGNWRISSLPDTVDETPAGQTDWREAAFSGVGTGTVEKSHAGWAPSEEKNSLAITEEEAAALARGQETLPVPANGRVQEDWAKAIREALPERAPAPQQPQTVAVTELPATLPPPPPPIPSPSIASEPAVPEATPDSNSWKPGAGNAWEAPSTNRLASAWEAAIPAPPATSEAAMLASDTVEAEAEPEVEEVQLQAEAAEPEEIAHPGYAAESLLEEAQPAAASAAEQEIHQAAVSLPAIETLLTPETQEILQEEAAHAVASEAKSPEHVAESASAASSEPTAATPPNMDEIVAKVLAKMNPEVMQAVTREILKPLVQAMIKDEMEKK